MDDASSTDYLVFVYGTLKRGEQNHSKITSEATGRAEFVGHGTTVTKYPLIVGSRYNIPFLLAQDDIGNNVEGEVYRVDDEKLKALDILENKYTRRLVGVRLASGDTVAAWIYFLMAWRADLINLEHLISYSSSAPYGPIPPREFIIKDMEETGYSIVADILGTAA